MFDLFQVGLPLLALCVMQRLLHASWYGWHGRAVYMHLLGTIPSPCLLRFTERWCIVAVIVLVRSKCKRAGEQWLQAEAFSWRCYVRSCHLP